MDSVTSPGASSASTVPAPAPAVEPSAKAAAVEKQDFRAYREAARADHASGAPSSTFAPASSAGQPEVPAASTDASSVPASEPGKPASKQPGHGGNAETRIKELLEENKRLKQSLTAPAPAPAAATKPSEPTSDPRPDHTDLTAYPDGQFDPKFIEDMGRWSARDEQRQADVSKQAREREAARTKASQQRNQQFSERMTAARAADPAFVESLSPDVLSLRPFDALQPGETPTAHHALAEEIVSSDVAPQLLRYFSEHPDELARFGRMSPGQLLKEFARVEDRVQASAKPAAPAAPPPVSSAPPPPASLEGRAHSPADPLRAAVVKGDFGAYRRSKQAALTAR